MEITPFHYVPKTLFLQRMSGFAFFAVILGFAILGIIMTTPALRPVELAPQSGIVGFYNSFLNDLKGIPPICIGSEALGDFQMRQCNNYQDRLVTEGVLAALPFLTFLLFLLVSLDLLATVYRKTRNKIKKKEIAFGAKVAARPLVKIDFFGWAFCLKAISVKIKDGKKMIVYMPLDTPVPLPGQTLAIYSLGKILGKPRFMAVLYAPHIAIIAGEKVS